MRKFTFILLSVLAILAIACSKKSDNTGTNTPLTFKNLIVSDTVMVVNGLITATADATGDGLSYHWTASYGSFVGSGASVKWTVCHADKFIITCEVTDQNGNSASKQRTIYVRE